MAGIFDYLSTLNLTPQERKALQARTTAPQGILEGEYIPRSEGIEQSRARLGVDPVSAQEQSRVGPERAGRTFYANSAGDVGTSVPKGSGTSGIYDAATEVAEKSGGAMRTLGKFAKVAGPLGFAYDAVNPQMLDDGELTPEQQAEQARGAVENMGQEKAAEAVQFGSDVSDRTLDAGLGRTAPLSLLNPNAPPEQPPVVETPVGAVAEAAPTNVRQAAAKTAQDQEVQRQQLETGAIKGLSTGAISRPEVADAVVDADIQRSGKAVTPEQKKALVAEELTNMKSMDNNQVARYISYGLMAAGLAAALLDKSGRAGDAFSASFNKQLDRNLAAGLQNQKTAAAAAKQAQDLKIALAGLGIKQQVADNGTASVQQTGEYRGRLLDQNDDKIDLTRQKNSIDASQGAAGLGLRREAMSMRQAQSDRSYELQLQQLEQGNERLKNERTGLSLRAMSAKAKEAANKVGKGVDITTKDASGLVDSALSSQNLNVDKAAKAALAQTVRVKAKNDPAAFAADPNGFILNVISAEKGPYEKSSSSIPWTNPSIRQRKLKQQ